MTSAVAPSASFKQIRQELKEWERTFRSLHGRSPTKDDIKASPPIRALYRQYACRKVNVQEKRQTAAENCDPSIFSRKNMLHENSNYLISVRSTSPATESSESSEGSHISATPPRKKSTICTKSDTLCKKTDKTSHSVQLHSLKACRPILGEIATNFGVPRNNHVEKVSSVASMQGLDDVLQCKILNRAETKTDPHQARLKETSKLNFTIKLHRYGERDKENVDVENIPAGFCLNRTLTSVGAIKPFSCKIFAREPNPCSSDTTLGAISTEATAIEMKTTENASSKDMKSSSSKVVNQANVVADCLSKQCESDIHLEVKEIAINNEPKDFSKLTIPMLKKLLLDKGIPSNGRKSQLIARLTQKMNDVNNVGKMTESVGTTSCTTCRSGFVSSRGAFSRTDLEKMTVATLREMLSSNGLPVSGTKAVLIARVLENVKEVVADLKKPSGVRKQITRGGKRKSCKETCSEHAAIPALGSSWPDYEVSKKPDKSESLQNNYVGSSASKRCKSTVELMSWHSVVKTDFLKKKAGPRENFVKLNIGKRSSKFHKFVNRASNRKVGGGKNRFKQYKRKVKKLANPNGEDAFQDCKQDEGIFDQDGEFLQQESERPSSQLENMQHVENRDSAFDLGFQNASLTSAASEALKNPTEQNLNKVLCLLFGHKSFRPGQIETIQKVLAGQSTILILPTGAGKSLSYQVPSVLLPGITLVVSPLVSVMVDQLRHLPPFLTGAVLSSMQTSKEYTSIVDKLRLGKLKVLFISPERLLCDKFLSLLQGLPCISLAVVDEAHCVSEWSHNFRPSYYRLGVILREKLKVTCILALTATATKRTLRSIMQTMSIGPSNLVQISAVRRNLICTASSSENRCKDLLSLLFSSPYKDARSIIIYCNFQLETENISSVLRDNGIDAKSYHGGMNPVERNRIQELFCTNKLQVVVATVAFGLGLDKTDVNAVIHYGLPNSVEHYVQETGRAGRNGDPAYCHLLFDNSSYLRLRSLAFSNNVDNLAIQRLLSKFFSEISLHYSSWQIQSISIESATKEFDVKEEVIATTLSYLEVGGDVQYVSVLPNLKTTCTLQFHKNSPTLLARNSLLIDAVLKRSREKHGEFTFELPAVANYMELKLPDLQKQLQELQTAGEISLALKNLSLCFYVLKVPEDLSALASSIAERFATMETLKVKKLDFMFQTATALSVTDRAFQEVQSSLQETVQLYFDSEGEGLDCKPPSIVKHSSSFLKADIKVFLQSNSTSLTSRAVARIFHGISSPAYPSTVWAQAYFWGKYKDTDFNIIKEAASQLLKSNLER